MKQMAMDIQTFVENVEGEEHITIYTWPVDKDARRRLISDPEALADQVKEKHEEDFDEEISAVYLFMKKVNPFDDKQMEDNSVGVYIYDPYYEFFYMNTPEIERDED